jgi:hypothetical protein
LNRHPERSGGFPGAHVPEIDLAHDAPGCCEQPRGRWMRTREPHVPMLGTLSCLRRRSFLALALALGRRAVPVRPFRAEFAFGRVFAGRTRTSARPPNTFIAAGVVGSTLAGPATARRHHAAHFGDLAAKLRDFFLQMANDLH